MHEDTAALCLITLQPLGCRRVRVSGTVGYTDAGKLWSLVERVRFSGYCLPPPPRCSVLSIYRWAEKQWVLGSRHGVDQNMAGVLVGEGVKGHLSGPEWKY